MSDGKGMTASKRGIGSVVVDLTVEIGAVEMPVSRLVKLTRGSVIPLARGFDEPLAVYVNGERIADAGVKLKGERIAVEISR